MWEINVGDQSLTLLYSFALGALLCVCYDFIRAMRKNGLNSFAAVFFTDIVFWIISGFVTFIFLMSRTNGEIRAYVLVSELLGFVLFRITLSRFLLFAFAFAIGKVVAVYAKISGLFYSVFEKTESALLKILKSLLKKSKIKLKSVKKLLKNRHKVLYTNENTADAEYVFNETEV